VNLDDQAAKLADMERDMDRQQAIQRAQQAEAQAVNSGSAKPRVEIISNGLTNGTIITVDGEPLAGVEAVTVTANSRDPLVRARVTVAGPQASMTTDHIDIAGRDVTRGDFGFALGVLRAGGRVTRVIWDGQLGTSAWLVLVPGSTFTVEEGRPVSKAFPPLVGSQVEYQPHIDLYQFGSLEVWAPSTTDLLATDWRVIPPTPPGSEAGSV
jgi:hypothetical protein